VIARVLRNSVDAGEHKVSPLQGTLNMRWVLLGIFGAIGAISRYLLGGVAFQLFGTRFPIGTLVVNVLGCLLIGFLGTVAGGKIIQNPQLRMMLFAGFLGALTTFSSFSFETWVLIKDGEPMLGALNILLNLIVGFSALGIGVFVGKIFS
jgi:CrcB protein